MSAAAHHRGSGRTAIERRDTTLDDMDAVYITDGITRMIILLDPAR